MKKTLVFNIICSMMVGFTWGQSQELPILPPEQPMQVIPQIHEITEDKDFMEIYGQMSRQRFPDTSLLTPSQLPAYAVGEAPACAPPVATPLQPPSQQLMDFALQQLEQLDRHKNVLLNDLRNAGTCGYHAAKFESVYAGLQSGFGSRRYVPTSSRFDWAIHGDGFFVLRRQREESVADEAAQPDENDTYFTRAGRFELTDDRKLCLKRNGDTFLLQPELEVDVFADLDATKCQIVRFTHPERLWRIDGVLFMAEHNGEKPELFSPFKSFGTTIHTQEYEASNVDVAETWQIYRALHKMQSAILDSVAF